MKICILICGLERCIDLVIANIEEIFEGHDIHIIVCLDNGSNCDNKNIIKKIFITDIHSDEYRNSLNYCHKMNNGLRLVEDGYDYYFIIRTDLILTSPIKFDEINTDRLYFSNKNMNQFTKAIPEKLNDNIIITTNYRLLTSLIPLYDFAKMNPNYLDVILYQYLSETTTATMTIEYKLILSKCNVIAIAGDSGSGKSTLLKLLTPLFDESVSLETDRYHKWERGDENYKTYTHLNPYANYIEKMYEDVYDLKIGNMIYQVDYDHTTGKFTQKEKIESKHNVIICGLHTLYMNKIIDINIYLDTDRELIKKWKIRRDVEERGYSLERVLEQIKNREKDYEEYIVKQKDNADIVIRFYEDNIGLQCNLIIQNDVMTYKIIKKAFICPIEYCENGIIIKLNGSDDYYDEILYFIKLIICE